MSDFIDTVTSLMPSSSGFDGSDVQAILDETLGPYFDAKEEDIEALIEAPLLTEAEGIYLDLLHGKLYGIERGTDEEDDEYRTRLAFQAKDRITINDLRELGCDVYAYVPDFNPTNMLTSRNTGLTRKLIIECPTIEVENLVKDNMIWEGEVVFI